MLDLCMDLTYELKLIEIKKLIKWTTAIYLMIPYLSYNIR